MTNLELIQGKLVFESFSTELIKSSLQSRSLNWADCYETSFLQNIELTTADLYVELSTVPEFKEGSLSIKYNASQLLKMAKNIYAKYGDDKLSNIKSNSAIESVSLW